MSQDHEAEVSRREEPIRPRDAAKPDKAGKKAQRQIDPDRLNKAIRCLKGHPNQQVGQGPDSRLSPSHLMPGHRRYFTAELLQVAHRISCPTPERNSTATKPIDSLSTLTHSFAGRSKLLSETIPVPVRPQWGQQSATAQAFNAVIMQVYLRFMTFVRRLRVGILCWAAHRICSKLHTSRGRTAVWRDLLARHPRHVVVGSAVSQAAVARS